MFTMIEPKQCDKVLNSSWIRNDDIRIPLAACETRMILKNNFWYSELSYLKRSSSEWMGFKDMWRNARVELRVVRTRGRRPPGVLRPASCSSSNRRARAAPPPPPPLARPPPLPPPRCRCVTTHTQSHFTTLHLPTYSTLCQTTTRRSTVFLNSWTPSRDGFSFM